MRLFRRAARREKLIDLRHPQCPACGGRHTELGWVDRVARVTCHWCDDCGHAWKVVDGEVPERDDTPVPTHLRF